MVSLARRSHPAETGSLSYGLLFRFPLLSTPLHGDAVTFSYIGVTSRWRGLPPRKQSVLTDARFPALPRMTPV